MTPAQKAALARAREEYDKAIAPARVAYHKAVTRICKAK